MTYLALTYALVVLLDRITKAWAVAQLTLGHSQPLMPFLHLTLVHNHGAAFGMLPGAAGLLLVIRGLVAIGVFPLAWRFATLPLPARIGLGLIGGGSAGNLIDGLRYGYVIDFLDLRVWPVFNIADMAIVAGGVVLAWQLLKLETREMARSR